MTKEDNKQQLQKLEFLKYIDTDNCHARVLKEWDALLALPSIWICNKSWKTKQVPKRMEECKCFNCISKW